MAAQSFQPVVLLTRPVAQSARFAESLRGLLGNGLRIVTSPLISPVFLYPVLPDAAWQAVILTSETGAEAAGRIKAHLPDLAFCVGDRTAQKAQRAGFTTLSAKGDAEALIEMILSHPAIPLLHLRGREVSANLAAQLTFSGRTTQEAVVYAQEVQPLTDEAASLLTGTQPVLVPLFSPRSAQILGAEYRRIGAKAPLLVIAMSAAVAEAATGLSSRPVRIARRPDGESMLEAVAAEWVAGQGA
ncbi:MAG: uroporphyrinogen-III synthase [Cypionkella sp.]